MTRWWFVVAEDRAWHLIHADAPCWKGELQLGRLVFGWQRTWVKTRGGDGV